MELVIRPAQKNDLEEIWHLFHANMVSRSDDRIRSELPKIWVMLQDSKMLGVLIGYFEAGEIKIDLVTIHPLYPEQQLREAIIKGVCAIIGLDRGKTRRMLNNCELAPGLG